MTNADKINMVKTMLSDSSITDNVVTVYLNLAKQKMLDRLYPMSDGDDLLPVKYDILHCELAVRLYLRRGGEGEMSHEENGVNRTYGSVDDEDILSRLTPYAVVM